MDNAVGSRQRFPLLILSVSQTHGKPKASGVNLPGFWGVVQFRRRLSGQPLVVLRRGAHLCAPTRCGPNRYEKGFEKRREKYFRQCGPRMSHLYAKKVRACEKGAVRDGRKLSKAEGGRGASHLHWQARVVHRRRVILREKSKQ